MVGMGLEGIGWDRREGREGMGKERRGSWGGKEGSQSHPPPPSKKS